MKSTYASSRRSFLAKGSAGILSAAMAGLPSFAGARPRAVSDRLISYAAADSNRVTLEKARVNIEKVRKRDVEITLLDKEGSPLKNRAVEVRQLKHEFLWGDNNWTMATMYRNGMADKDRGRYYRKRFADVLNSLNTTVYWTERPRNDGTKTMDFQGDLRLDDFDESVNWANAHGLVAKGHPIFWTVPKAVPEWAKKYPVDTMMKFVEVRVRNLCARYQGRVKVWDAVNEMLWETAPKNLPKRQWPYTETTENMVEYIGKVLKWAREEDSEALYAINDYGIGKTNQEGLVDQHGDPVTAARQRKRYVELVNRLGDAGYPPNLLGMQTRPAWLFPSEQVAIYDELYEARVPITITEFWPSTRYLQNEATRKTIESEEWRSFEMKNVGVELSDEEIEAIRDEFVLNFMTCAFGHPAIHSFYFWGFMGSAVQFQPHPSSSHTLAPIYDKVRKLIHEDWNTRLVLTTDSQGKVRFRGFCGDYSARVQPRDAAPIGLTFNVSSHMDTSRVVLRSVL
jgi:GH35 family endo-1,4-beta-xylanase